jgi:inorganic phosphate transporter, PiT family
MSTVATPAAGGSLLDKKMKKGPGMLGAIIFLAVLLGGLAFCAINIFHDMGHIQVTSAWPYVMLAVALLIALGFEFVNGFHDTANAVATVIYTHTLEPHVAVVWSGIWNLIGVLTSSGAVAYAVITLLPVELILKVSGGAGFAMVFALLIAAILWNLSTWWLGLPASSSHTMVGSIIGVGIANQLMSGNNGTAGVEWDQVIKVFRVLLISPVVGFVLAWLLMLVTKALVKYPALFTAPEGDQPPPLIIRALLVLTCTGVSFGHGSNDGQKGMGLIMLILIGTVPTAYALNHTMGEQDVLNFVAVSQQAQGVINSHVDQNAIMSDPRADVTEFIKTKEFTPTTMIALRELIGDISHEVGLYKEMKAVPPQDQQNVRNDMYVASAAIAIMHKSHKPTLSPDEDKIMVNYEKNLDKATKFIPLWVKIAVALALGMGTMVGWKRIVVTVGEKIGKDHLTYAQGASAELVAMATIIAADNFGMPVSTTHVLSSGIAGTMVANGSGLQWATLRSIAMAWVFTLPAAALLSGSLYWLFRQFVS